MNAVPRRKIDVTVTLGTGDFGDGTGNVVTLSGLQVSASIIKMGMPGLDQATVSVYGATQDFMNRTTRLGVLPNQIRNNGITISAGDDVSGMAQVFTGTINEAYQDFTASPETCIRFSAMANGLALLKPVAPLSFPAGADISVIMSSIAASMGLGFQNDGVTGVFLSNQYLPGTAIDQMRAAAKAANINVIPNGGPTGQTLEIWPMGGARTGLSPTFTPQDTLIGYPRVSDLGIAITALYTPNLRFGGRFNLDQSAIPGANGSWYCQGVTYDLESETPQGKWFMDIVGSRLAQGAPA